MLYTEYERGYPKGDPSADPPEFRKGPQKRILYNSHNEVITELPLSLNYIEVSSDGQYFVATRSSSVESDFIYFYDIRGKLLKKQEMHGYPGFKFSSNSEYVKVITSSPSNPFGEAYLFTKTGDFITKYDYGTLFHDNLFDFHVSDNAEWLLFSMFNSAYLISRDGQILWQKSYLRVIDCRFNKDKNYLILYSPLDRRNLKESQKSIKIVSLLDGEFLESLDDITLLQLTKDRVVIKKGETCYEYMVK